jgi:TetR/AcrR family transcriptional regulator
MARPRAANYDDRRLEMIKCATRLFSDNGYDRTSMTEISTALGVSKALFYHYYRAKDDLLYDIIRSHLLRLVDATVASVDVALPPEKRLHHMIRAILACYSGADSEHKVQIDHIAKLKPSQQRELKDLQRQLVSMLSDVVQSLRPAMPMRMVKPLTMSIFGTLNWKYMWFRKGAGFTEEDFAGLVTDLFARGIKGLELPHQR